MMFKILFCSYNPSMASGQCTILHVYHTSISIICDICMQQGQRTITVSIGIVQQYKQHRTLHTRRCSIQTSHISKIKWYCDGIVCLCNRHHARVVLLSGVCLCSLYAVHYCFNCFFFFWRNKEEKDFNIIYRELNGTEINPIVYMIHIIWANQIAE